ncbi:unnamed protein product [Mytilus coruscus]|uniref:Vitellogenin domain-containing protein n=1 Tax=Mytilus coruscus TaxID=42192 RepID=A0A6J8CEZ2_MYTCO|nr:unnamed protein product [Mytilus coruscus]
MKVNVCLLLTIVSAYCLIDGCEGTRWGHWRPPVRGYPPIRRWSPIRTWHPRPTTTMYRGRKSAEFMDENLGTFTILKQTLRMSKHKRQSNTEELTDFSQDSPIFQSINLSQDSQIYNWSDDVGMHTFNRISTALVPVSKGSFSPLKYQLETPLDKIKESTMRYIKRKANQSVYCVMEAIAPGQGVAVKKIFLREMKNPLDQYVVQPDLVQEILQLYNATTDNKIRRQLLTLISKQLSKQELMKAIPDLTTYRIDQARLEITTAFSSACAASKRTSLHGLDNIAAEGSKGYDNLINLVEDLHRMNVINSEESKELTNSINSTSYIYTCAGRSGQDWFAVVSLLEHTLIAVKQQLRDIKEISLRSDNAGCYHCSIYG